MFCIRIAMFFIIIRRLHYNKNCGINSLYYNMYSRRTRTHSQNHQAQKVNLEIQRLYIDGISAT